MNKHRSLTIESLYPELSADQRQEAAANLRRYLAVLLSMSERLAAEGRSINDLVDCQFDSQPDHR